MPWHLGYASLVRLEADTGYDRLIVDLLAEGVTLLNGILPVTYPAAPPSNDYYLSCKYQFYLSGTPRLFRLMIL